MTNNFTTHTDHLNHELIIRYNGLERRLDFKYESEKNVMKLVNEMRAEIREEKLKKLGL